MAIVFDPDTVRVETHENPPIDRLSTWRSLMKAARFFSAVIVMIGVTVSCCGAMAQTLEIKLGLGKGQEAFLAGLLHDIGKVILDSFLHKE